MEEGKLHWLGGMIDADGSIYLTLQKRQNAKFGFSMFPTVKVTGSDHPHYQVRHEIAVELVREVTDSDADFEEQESKNEWGDTAVRASQAVDLLEAIEPYLREKQPIAQRILEVDWDGNKTGAHGRSAEQWREMVECREDIVEMMSHTNTKRKYDKDDLLKAIS